MAFKEYFTDKDFIEGIKNNDEIALKLLYKRHFQMIASLVTHNNGTYQEAKDIYQEAIIILYHNIRKKEFKLESQLKTYIYSVCRRLWLNELKHKNKQISITDNFDGDKLFDENIQQTITDHEVKFDTMHQSLEELGGPCKEIITDFYINKISMEDIALKMGYTNADNAKNQKYKCLQRLKKIYFKIFNEQKQSNDNK